MTEKGAILLAKAIILQAALDLESMFEKIMRIKKACARGDLPRRIYQDKRNRKKKKYILRSFETKLPNFFRGRWGRFLMDVLELEQPPELKQKIEVCERFLSECYSCIAALYCGDEDAWKNKRNKCKCFLAGKNCHK